MDSKLDKGYQIIGQRNVWETKQRMFYQLRHEGLRRINKPFPNCADSNFPLIDIEIGNLKPFWLSNVFSGERLADFVSLKEQMEGMAESAADFMDFELRYRTDFRYRFEQASDYMLLGGRGVLKTVMDPRTGKFIFRPINPIYILMGQQYDDFDDADYFIEAQTLTVPQYKRNPNFNQDSGVIAAIRGKEDWAGMQTAKLEKEFREGITHSSRDDTIILWNHYEKTESGYIVSTFSPMAEDKKIRDDYRVQLEWDGEALQPFTSLIMEIKDEGWYAPRGIGELSAAFQAYCTKLWNEKSDAMTFGNRPIFTSEGEIQNGANLRFMPGELIPGNIKPVQMPPPAFSFAEEINFTRGLSEQRTKMPDYGVTGPGDTQTGGKPRTATENNRIASLQDIGSAHNGEIFRSVVLPKIFKRVWANICHREDMAKASGKPGKLVFYVAQDLKTLPGEALHDQYLVLPAGGAGTKQQRLQRAVARYQLFKGLPNVDQDELVRGVVSADDSRLVKKLLMPQGIRQGKEAEDEAMEIGIMILGFPAQVAPGEDQITRIKTIIGFLEKAHVTGMPVDPIAKQRIMQHLAQHFQILQSTDPGAAKQLKAAIMQMEAQYSQGQPASPNGVPPPGGGPPPTANGNGAPPANGAVKESVSINYKDAPEDIKRQMEKAAGFTPSALPPAPQLTPPRP